MGKRAKRHKRREQYPVATVIYYGPDDRTATKVAVGIVHSPGQEPVALRRWFGQGVDRDLSLQGEVAEFIRQQGARSVVVSEGILGCPHEEGIDYLPGDDCPYCSFWKGKPRNPGSVTLLPTQGTGSKPEKPGSRAIFAIADYTREQWQTLMEVAADRDKLEASYQEWQATKEESVTRLRRQGYEVCQISIDVGSLQEYCRQRGIANDSASRVEYAAYRMRMELGGKGLEPE